MSSRVSLTYLAVVAFLGCGDGGGFPDAPAKQPPQDPGTIALGWSIVDDTGSATTCGSAGASFVVVGIVQEGTLEQFGQTFGCSIGVAVTGSLPTATYDLTFKLTDGSNVLASGSPQTGLVVQPDMTAHANDVVFALP